MKKRTSESTNKNMPSSVACTQIVETENLEYK